MTKRLVTITALVEVEAGSDTDARTIGGNIARQIQGVVPTQYDVKGVEVQGITDPEAEATTRSTGKTSAREETTSAKGDKTS